MTYHTNALLLWNCCYFLNVWFSFVSNNHLCSKSLCRIVKKKNMLLCTYTTNHGPLQHLLSEDHFCFLAHIYCVSRSWFSQSTAHTISCLKNLYEKVELPTKHAKDSRFLIWLNSGLNFQVWLILNSSFNTKCGHAFQTKCISVWVNGSLCLRMNMYVCLWDVCGAD